VTSGLLPGAASGVDVVAVAFGWFSAIRAGWCLTRGAFSGGSRRSRLRYRCSMNSGTGAFQGSWEWLASDPSLVGLSPSSRAICKCA
jgi:hypothetical protein